MFLGPVLQTSPDDLIQKADLFGGYVGFAAKLTPGARGLRQLMQEPDAQPRLLKLVTTATPEGKLFALVGLRKFDRALARKHLLAMGKQKGKARVGRGCALTESPFKEITAEIEKGSWDFLSVADPAGAPPQRG